MAPKLLTEQQIEQRIEAVSGWRREGKAIRRTLVFNDFREVVSFLVLIAFDAEEADHHPDVTINYKRLHLSLSTHSEGGLTEKDFALAGIIDKHFGS